MGRGYDAESQWPEEASQTWHGGAGTGVQAQGDAGAQGVDRPACGDSCLEQCRQPDGRCGDEARCGGMHRDGIVIVGELSVPPPVAGGNGLLATSREKEFSETCRGQ